MKRVDLILLFGVIVITIFGLVMIYSSSYVWAQYKFNNAYKFVITQGLFLIIGYMIMMIVINIDYKKYLDKANIIFGVCYLVFNLVNLLNWE